jgi:pimeloyl-ACP methyl ester carboxylesterase
VPGVFVPGWGAVPGLYARGLPAGWQVLKLPAYGPTGGELTAYCRWLDDEIAQREGPISLAGHSMGAALAVLVAADRPAAIERLILLSPAGLPLSKPLTASLAAFLGQIVRGWYPFGELSRAVSGSLRSPRAALSLARAVHELDLSSELERLKASPVPSTVVGCSTDRLTTPDHCRRLAALLGARYHEVGAAGGHVWMIAEPRLLTAALASDTDNPPPG